MKKNLVALAVSALVLIAPALAHNRENTPQPPLSQHTRPTASEPSHGGDGKPMAAPQHGKKQPEPGRQHAGEKRAGNDGHPQREKRPAGKPLPSPDREPQ